LRGCAHAHKRREGLKERERDKQRKKKKGQNLQLPLLCSCRLLFFFCQDVAFLDFFVWWCSCLTMSGAFQLQQLSRVGSPHASTHMWSASLGVSHGWSEVSVLPAAPLPPKIPEKASDDQKLELIAEYDDLLLSYESSFSIYWTWLDDDAGADSILAASIVDFELAHQMWAFLYDRYAPTRQSTYLADIH
jgi:hypothetical protein